MSNVIVQFSDATESTVVAYFASPQDSEVYACLGLIDVSDDRWAEFYDSANGESSGLPSPR
ncbi:hypothetical protein ATI02_5430 [Pseudomonas baetica]|uniref:Uncharacterized protein n=1 Tax=Pseudomonas baetica TaxID=674054 RepID=A0ABX4Q6N7_9PSED|nr:hypothetical protein ATI02_5430 [Pseudomonas baetica]